MAAEQLNWGTKVKNNGQTAQGRLSAVEANDLQAKFNANAVLLDEIQLELNMITENRTPIPVTEGALTIDWQNDLVPNDFFSRTYVARFGNMINSVTGLQLLGIGGYSNYSPEFTFSMDGQNIDTVTFPLLQTGFINFL